MLEILTLFALLPKRDDKVFIQGLSKISMRKERANRPPINSDSIAKVVKGPFYGTGRVLGSRLEEFSHDACRLLKEGKISEFFAVDKAANQSGIEPKVGCDELFAALDICILDDKTDDVVKLIAKVIEGSIPNASFQSDWEDKFFAKAVEYCSKKGRIDAVSEIMTHLIKRGEEWAHPSV